MYSEVIIKNPMNAKVANKNFTILVLGIENFAYFFE